MSSKRLRKKTEERKRIEEEERDKRQEERRLARVKQIRREVHETLTYEQGLELLLERKCLSCKVSMTSKSVLDTLKCPLCGIFWTMEDLQGLQRESD